MAQIRQSRPDSGLGFQAKALKSRQAKALKFRKKPSNLVSFPIFDRKRTSPMERRVMKRSLHGEYGTNKTVKARSLPWLSGRSS